MSTKKTASEKKAQAKSTVATKPKATDNSAKNTDKKSKNTKTKVIKDSFPFPKQEYGVLSELKQACIAAGVPVKRGEILRVGLSLLSQLDFSEIKRLVQQVEKIQPGRSSAAKN
ncbi:MAG: hypothetical protein HOP02_00810 [Methylococcaceae bacterium]|nr:hypothetical protein [Methylococcaceae bacterium]